MKSYKSIICVLLVFAMVFALCACGRDNETSDDTAAENTAAPSETTETGEDNTPAPSETTGTDEDKAADNDEDNGTAADEDKDEGKDTDKDVDKGEDKDKGNNTPTETDAGIDTGFDIGTVNGRKYENKFLGFGCEFDSSWSYTSEEELLSMIGMNAAAYNDEELKESLKKADMFYDMMAISDDGFANAAVTVQNVGAIYGEAFSEEEMVEANAQQLPAELEAEEMTVKKCDVATVKFAGAERNAIVLHSVYQHINVYQTVIFIKCGSYLVNVTVSSYVKNTVDSIIDHFYAL